LPLLKFQPSYVLPKWKKLLLLLLLLCTNTANKIFVRNVQTTPPHSSSSYISSLHLVYIYITCRTYHINYIRSIGLVFFAVSKQISWVLPWFFISCHIYALSTRYLDLFADIFFAHISLHLTDVGYRHAEDRYAIFFWKSIYMCIDPRRNGSISLDVYVNALRR